MTMTVSFPCLLLAACAGVPWGEVAPVPTASTVPESLICQGGESPAPGEEPAPSVEGRAPAPVYELLKSRHRAHEDCQATSTWGSGEAGRARVHVSFSIDEAGSVEGACIREPLPPEGKAAACILDDLKAQSFGRGEKAEVKYSFELTPAVLPEIDPSTPPKAEPLSVP